MHANHGSIPFYPTSPTSFTISQTYPPYHPTFFHILARYIRPLTSRDIALSSMGHHNLRFDGDAHSLHGAWSPPTSRAKYVPPSSLTMRDMLD